MFRISYLNLISPQGMNILLLTLCLLSIPVLAPKIKRASLFNEKLYAFMVLVFGMSALIRLFWWFMGG
ncbi:MAG: hypothetical protein IT240_00555 [Bacteroidia bacterium]|nr:hypothetical protein [Bacteroidia bacterium]